ncbi:MAG: hypothetical protein L0G27_05840 [Paracoccus sp. (in: a-proteobacteria)]|nr:hypothetical protein [Paracoccus sp. (in: a-proteobacteria)]
MHVASGQPVTRAAGDTPAPKGHLLETPDRSGSFPFVTTQGPPCPDGQDGQPVPFGSCWLKSAARALI